MNDIKCNYDLTGTKSFIKGKYTLSSYILSATKYFVFITLKLDVLLQHGTINKCTYKEYELSCLDEYSLKQMYNTK
jgi:hypothetical protein